MTSNPFETKEAELPGLPVAVCPLGEAADDAVGEPSANCISAMRLDNLTTLCFKASTRNRVSVVCPNEQALLPESAVFAMLNEMQAEIERQLSVSC